MIEAAKLEADIYPAGPRGLSAYEIYKKEGGQLSEEEWLKSLNGLTPTIGENGNWFLGTVDTGLPSRGPKGDTGSIKFIVVTELPTENIDETAIYLKPVESPTGENNFEELIYVNGKWEDLGTPNVAVDLSNYYTKEETDVIIPAILCINESGGYFSTTRAMELSEDNKKRFSEFVNKHPNEPFLVYIFDYYHISCCMDLCYFSPTGGPTTTGKNSTVQYVSVSGNNNESKGLGKIVYSYSLDKNNIITFTKIKILLSDVYYPTKKYVDDAVVAKQDVLTAGDNITISEENVISAKGGDKLHDYNIYTITLDDYNLKGTFPTITDTTTLAKFDEILTDIYKKRIAANATHDNAFLIVYSSSDTFIFRISNIQASYCYLYGTYIEEPIDNNGYTRGYQFYITGTLDTTAQTFKTTKVKFDRNSKRVLLTNNTLSYTPTGEYNPATKKYVDDSINALPSSAGSTPIYNFAYDESVEFYCGYNNINYVVSTNEKNVNRASEIINDMYANGFGTAIINFYNKNSANASSYMCTMQFGSIHNKSTSFTFMAFNKKQHLYTQTYDFDNFRLDINGTWTNDVFTANEIICQGIAIEFSGGIASVDYVNNSISSAITTSLEASY